MSMGNGREAATDLHVVPDAVCPYCECVCDDLEIRIEKGRIVEARNACEAARLAYLTDQPRGMPACLVDGEPSSVEEGIRRAAGFLAGSRHPLIFGMGWTTTEACRAAIALGEPIGACIDFSGIESDHPVIDALQSIGEASCTLGEVRNRAELILVWGADPVLSHPRLLSRYALEPVGTFLPEGRRDRYCIVVDAEESRTAREAADHFLAIKQGSDAEAIWVLRALAKGIELEAEAAKSATGVPLDAWRDLIERMRAARYGIVFYRPAPMVAYGIHALVREMNAFTRFTCMAVSPHRAHLVGPRNVLAWSTGYPAAVSLARGYPRYGPREFGAVNLLRDGRVDVALLVGGALRAPLPAEARDHLGRIPTIVLDSRHDDPPPAAVVFRTGVFGIDTTGTVYRMDGVPLPLRPILTSPVRNDVEILREIQREVISLLARPPASDGGG